MWREAALSTVTLLVEEQTMLRQGTGYALISRQDTENVI